MDKEAAKYSLLREEEGEFKLVVGSGTIDLQDVGIVSAFCTWAASYPVFNIKFNHGDPRGMCILMYRVALGLDGGPAFSSKTLALLKCLL